MPFLMLKPVSTGWKYKISHTTVFSLNLTVQECLQLNHLINKNIWLVIFNSFAYFGVYIITNIIVNISKCCFISTILVYLFLESHISTVIVIIITTATNDKFFCDSFFRTNSGSISPSFQMMSSSFVTDLRHSMNLFFLYFIFIKKETKKNFILCMLISQSFLVPS